MRRWPGRTVRPQAAALGLAALGLAALALAAAGCSSGSASSSQAEQAMYSAASRPAHPAGYSLRPGQRWAGPGPAGLRMAVPQRWVSLRSPATRRRARHEAGLGQATPAQLAALLPGWGTSRAVDLADPGPSGRAGTGAQAVISLGCAPDHFPPGTDPVTGLTARAESAFSALSASNDQVAQTSVDGRPALLIYEQAAVGSKTVTALQYLIAAPAGRACAVTLVTEKAASYEPLFGQLRPGIQISR
jgi:hypothetical protein